jgi:hypothetical protein
MDPETSMNFPVISKCAAREALCSLPRLDMDEYVAFLSESMSHADPAKVAKQKALEERITVPFRIRDK